MRIVMSAPRLKFQADSLRDVRCIFIDLGRGHCRVDVANCRGGTVAWSQSLNKKPRNNPFKSGLRTQCHRIQERHGKGWLHWSTRPRVPIIIPLTPSTAGLQLLLQLTTTEGTIF